MNKFKEDEANPFIPTVPSAPPAPSQEMALFSFSSTTPVINYNQANLTYPLIEIRRVETTNFKVKFENNLRKHFPQKFVILIALLVLLINLALLIVEVGFTPDWSLLKSYATSNDNNKDNDFKCDQLLCYLLVKFILFWLKLLFLFLMDVHIYLFGYYKAFIAFVNVIYAILGLTAGMLFNYNTRRPRIWYPGNSTLRHFYVYPGYYVHVDYFFLKFLCP